MESKQVQIRFLNSRDYDGIIMSHDLCRELGLDNHQKIYVQLGQRKVLTNVFMMRRSNREILIPPLLRRKLAIPFGGLLNIKMEQNTLRIGPVMGILTTGVHIIDNQVVSKRTYFFRHLLSAQKGEGIFYFLFTPSDVDWASKTVRGTFLRQGANGQIWRRFVIPLPDVVYNRIPNRVSEKMDQVRQFRVKYEQLPDTKMFNPTFFNKWFIHQRLENDSFARNHIPETYISPTMKMIQNMLFRHRMVYLKPVGGSLGLGILKITYQPGMGYFCRYHANSQNILRRYRSLSALLQAHIARSRFSSYLVQQGIQLIRINGRPVDFRVHAHKNRQNKWVVAAIAAKVAGQGSVTTHVRTGGTVLSGQDLLHRAFPGRGDAVEEKIKEIAVKLAAAIESQINQHIGELGFDIGIDVKGHIWMFEANSRPGRSIFKHKSLKQADRESIHLIVDYSRYLANFN